VDHAGSLGFALDASITLAILRGDLADAECSSERLGQLGANVGFEVWMVRREILQGIIQVRSGDLADGVPRLQSALLAPRRRMASYRAPLFLAELAQAEAAAGMPEQALVTIDDAIDWFGGADAFWCAPECFRVKAEILRLHGGSNAIREADSLRDRAIDLAGRQKAVGWQRRILPVSS
jgi:hypothetical protein